VAKVTFDANSGPSSGAEIILSDETVVSLYVFPVSGRHLNHKVSLQASPDGVLWVDVGGSAVGLSNFTVDIAAERVRACLVSDEGDDSSIEVHVVAK
jgi:hypothetical protein